MMLNNGVLLPSNNVIHGSGNRMQKFNNRRAMDGGGSLPKLMHNLSLFDVNSKMSGRGMGATRPANNRKIKFII